MPHEFLLPVQLHERWDRLVDLLLEQDRVVTLAAPHQFRLDRIRKVRGGREPLIRALGLVIDLADLRALPLLVDELERRQEIIQEGAQGTVDGGEGLVF
jgi:hypothetical protein